MEATRLAKAKSVDMKLEVVMLGVSDVDRAKAFYEKLGWRLDIDFAAGDFRGVQMTPHNSEASIIFGKGITSAKPGSARSLVLAVDDIDAARDDLIARGVDVSEVFHYAGGPFNNTVGEPARRRARPGRSFLLLVRLVRGSGRERLAAPGDHDAASRPRVEVDASTSHGRRDPCRAPPRDGAAPRPLREDARRAPLVGLVRALPERASERQQSGGGGRRRRPPHGGGPSCSSPMTPFEWPHSPSTSTAWVSDRLLQGPPEKTMTTATRVSPTLREPQLLGQTVVVIRRQPRSRTQDSQTQAQREPTASSPAATRSASSPSASTLSRPASSTHHCRRRRSATAVTCSTPNSD